MPEQRKGFDLGDYVEVKDRIKLFYELYAQGRLVTTQVSTELGPDGTPRVLVEAAAYRTPDDPLPARGWSWMALPGTTSYTKGSELENTETSAWGRAIAALGILVDRSIASASEVRNKAEDGARSERNPRVGAADYEPPQGTNGGLIGTAEKGTAKTTDYLVRESKDDGPFLGFRLKDGRSRGGQIIEAWGPLAIMLAVYEQDIIGQRVQVWGHPQWRELSNGGSYVAFKIDRLQVGELILSAQEAAGQPPQAEVADEADSSGTTLTTTDPAPTATDAPPDSVNDPDTGGAESAHALPDSKGVTPDNQCDSASPFGDNLRCELMEGHKGVHSVLSQPFPEKWADR